MSDRHRDIPETAAETAARETIEVHDTFYRIGGERYTRVTTVLNVMDKPALVPWAFRTANETWTEELLATGTVRFN